MTADNLEKFTGVLKGAYQVRGEGGVSAQFENNVMRKIRLLKSESEESSFANLAAPIYLRFSFAALLMAVVVHTSYRVSFIEKDISVSSLTQLDPFDVSGEIDE